MRRSSHSEIRSRLDDAVIKPEGFADWMAKKCGGHFLYLVYVQHDIVSGSLSAMDHDSPPTGMESATPPRPLSVGGGSDTRVEWTLEEDDSGTRLILKHQGFRGQRGLLARCILGKGWGSSRPGFRQCCRAVG
jgi:hypothetical protein